VKHHLQEDRLFDCYVADRGGEAIDPPSAEHLADCSECAARYAELAAFMDGVRADGEADLDERFSPEQLRAQQKQIARRIEHVGHPARVISFPGQSPRHPSGTRLSPMVLRWVVTATAAGLFIGVYVGTFVHRPTPAPFVPRMASTAPSVSPVDVPVVVSTDADPAPLTEVVADDANDQFLLEVELAAEQPRTRELLALDELTPHVRPIRTGLQ
jgi:hypothetical protein